jgi:NAD(P)H dehydrogenase (quinone)
MLLAKNMLKLNKKAVQRGVNSHTSANSHLISVDNIEDVQWDQIYQADAIIFECPTYMGSTSAEFKKFMEASLKRWMQQTWKNKIAAGFTNSELMNGDKLNTLIDLAIFATQHSMILVGLDILPVSSSTQDGFKEPNRLGSF